MAQADAEGALSSRDRRVAERLPRSEPRVAPPLLGIAWNVLPRARGRRWRRDGTGLSRHDQSCRRGRRTRSDGDGDHPLHGQGVRCPPQSRGQYRVLAAWRLPMASRAGIHRLAVGWRDACGTVPARGSQAHSWVQFLQWVQHGSSAVPVAAAQAQLRHRETFSRKSSTRRRSEGAMECHDCVLFSLLRLGVNWLHSEGKAVDLAAPRC